MSWNIPFLFTSLFLCLSNEVKACCVLARWEGGGCKSMCMGAKLSCMIEVYVIYRAALVVYFGCVLCLSVRESTNHVSDVDVHCVESCGLEI
jgi:hypothetical protein